MALQSVLLVGEWLTGINPFWDNLQETLTPWAYSESSGKGKVQKYIVTVMIIQLLQKFADILGVIKLTLE